MTQVVADDSGSWDKEQWHNFHAEALPLMQEEGLNTSWVHEFAPLQQSSLMIISEVTLMQQGQGLRLWTASQTVGLCNALSTLL